MPIVIPIAIPLLALAAAFGALLLMRTESMWLRPMVEALQHPRGSWIKRQAFKAAGFLAQGTLFIERHVRAALSHFAASSLHLLTRWFNGLGTLFHHLFAEVADLAEDVAHTFDRVVLHTVPAQIKAAVHPVSVLAHQALKLAHQAIALEHELDKRLTHGIDRLRNLVEGEMVKLLHGIDRLVRDHVIPALRRAEHAIDGVITRDLPALRRREAALEREVYGDLTARIKRIERLLGLGVIAAVVYRILARVAPWLFCRNVKKLGNVACGLPARDIDALLGVLFGALAISSLEQLARYAIEVEDEVADEVKRLLKA